MAFLFLFLLGPTITFDDVCGLKEVKDVFVEKIIIPLKFPHLFKGCKLENDFSLHMCTTCAFSKSIINYKHKRGDSPGFETHNRRHQKSETGVQNCPPSKKVLKKLQA